MPFAVKEDKAPNPLTVGLLGPDRIMFEAHHLADLVQQFELGIGNEAVGGEYAFAFPISNLTANIKPY